MRDGLRTPAEAATPALLPATAALPAAVGGTPMPSLAPMLQRVLPAVVSVHSEQHVQVSPFGNDPIFSRLFRQLTRDRINQSLGSGVIVDAQKGYVLTNHHVIEGADAVSVTLSDGRTLKAEFLGSGSRHRRRADAHPRAGPDRDPARQQRRAAWAISWSRSAIRSGSGRR